MAKVVITALNTFANRGVEALGQSIVDGVRQAAPEAKITVTTRDLEGAAKTFAGRDVRIVPDSAWSPPVDASSIKKTAFRLRRWLRRAAGRRTPSEKALDEADLVLVSGGDVFSSDYSIMERYLRQLDPVCAAGTPILFVAQSIGPFATTAELESFRTIARHASFTVRERISRSYLTSTVGVAEDRVVLTADPAFLLPVDPAVRDRLLAHYGLEAPFVALAVSRGISGFSGIDHGRHVEAWTEAVRELVRQGVQRFAFVPHVQLAGDTEDDRTLAMEIAQALAAEAKCVVIAGDHSATDFKAILSAAEFVIAERTHGAIGAMSQGVPTLSVGYSIKARGVLEELIEDPKLLEVSIVSAGEFADPDGVAELVRRAWTARAAFAEALASSLPRAKARAAQNYEVARALVDARR